MLPNGEAEVDSLGQVITALPGYLSPSLIQRICGVLMYPLHFQIMSLQGCILEVQFICQRMEDFPGRQLQ